MLWRPVRGLSGTDRCCPQTNLPRLKLRLREHRIFRRNQLRELSAWPRQAQTECTSARIEVQAQLTAAAMKVLTDIDAALNRIETGVYGHCEICEAPIGLQRLRIMPHLRYCAQCHHAEEVAVREVVLVSGEPLSAVGAIMGDQELSGEGSRGRATEMDLGSATELAAGA
ncbi:DksA/TraR C4-type zinc finger protein [Kribbella rubisoli]|uniref:DksA/TraR C4-type zinc finger protein n=1 Tax=Kribbella rubisoli TaxID=3075929 RepID=A0A4Q7X0K5_9ACTN|nr:TraR/DksA C4-type zinc finger protein [Kribbella rubisoli]RZU16341.1 DksA/TraR C4-type zinc finger protein [Kribbella rubisoli]